MKKYIVLICSVIIFSGCGGGGGKSTSAPPMVAPPPEQPTEPVQPPQPVAPPPQPIKPKPPVGYPPVPEFEGPFTPHPEELANKIGDVGKVEVAFRRHGNDADLELYFRDIVKSACAFAGRCTGDIVKRFESAPVVKISGYASDEHTKKVKEAIRIVNSALPDSYKMSFSSDIAPRAIYRAITRVPEGEIHVGFDTSEYDAELRNTSGYTRRYFDSTGSFDGAHIWTTGGHLSILVREFLHALGLITWVDNVPSILVSDSFAIERSLTATDRKALKALYTDYDNGDDMLSDGPWNSSGFSFTARLTSGCVGYCGHIVGELHFGVTYENDLGRPWVNGPTPTTDVARNSSLVPDPSLGEVRYKGSVVGVDSEERLVFGDALFDLDLDVLEGVVTFYNLRARNIHNTNDFNIDRGDKWGRGYIGGYRVQITGNSFENTSAGIEGKFFGPSHEYVGGTFQNTDFNAAFGARRPR